MQRRDFLRGCLASLITAATARVSVDAAQRFANDPFTLGVASGDPSPDGAVLWTRLAPDPLNGGGMGERALSVEWRVASDERMQRVVKQGTEVARPTLAHSVHAEVRGLAPNREYWYQFNVGTGTGRVTSAIGRTRTAPATGANLEQFRFAFASCQKYEDGYYTAYQRMAEEDLSLVVFLGDYIYESGRTEDRVRLHPALEAVTLDQYRLRYALYKSDPDLQRVHARFPWAAVFDDHEVSDNFAGGIPGRAVPEGFLQRRAAAYQAYYEHLPFRLSSMPGGQGMAMYRTLSFGNLARFHLLDTRQYRTGQPCGGSKAPCADRDAPSQTMMGAAQENWFMEDFSQSRQRWNVIAQQTVLSSFDSDPGPGELYSMDSWDGYPVARARLTDFLSTRARLNPIVLAGDAHGNWVFDVKRDFRDEKSPAVATEFVGTSISSEGDGADQSGSAARAMPANPHCKFSNARRGYVRCNLTPSLWTTDFRTVPYVEMQGAPIQTAATFVVENGKPGALRR